MQQDVRRSDSQESQPRSQEAEPAPKAGGFARSFFQFGGKRNKKAQPADQAQLQNRLREVLERDRALIASAPAPEVEDVHEVLESWPHPHEPHDPTHTEMRVVDGATMLTSEPDEEEAWPDPASFRAEEPVPGVLELATGRESADLAFSQIASWIEEEISELPDGEVGPVALDAPLDEAEAAELDAVLAGNDTLISTDPAFLSALVAPPAPVEEAVAEPAVEKPVAKSKPAKAKPSAPEEPACEEPIRTLTMARLLAMQGYKPRALAVYRELLRRTPDDEALRAEMEKLKASE